MKVNGKMIYSMDKVLKNGPTVQNIKVNMLEEKSMEWEFIVGTMVQDMKVSGSKTKLEEWVLIHG